MPGYRPVPCMGGRAAVSPSFSCSPTATVTREVVLLVSPWRYQYRPLSRVGVYLDSFCCESSSFLFLGRGGTGFIVVVFIGRFLSVRIGSYLYVPFLTFLGMSVGECLGLAFLSLVLVLLRHKPRDEGCLPFWSRSRACVPSIGIGIIMGRLRGYRVPLEVFL